MPKGSTDKAVAAAKSARKTFESEIDDLVKSLEKAAKAMATQEGATNRENSLKLDRALEETKNCVIATKKAHKLLEDAVDDVGSTLS